MLLYCAIEGHKITVEWWGNPVRAEQPEQAFSSKVGGIEERIFHFFNFETNIP